MGLEIVGTKASKLREYVLEHQGEKITLTPSPKKDEIDVRFDSDQGFSTGTFTTRAVRQYVEEEHTAGRKAPKEFEILLQELDKDLSVAKTGNRDDLKIADLPQEGRDKVLSALAGLQNNPNISKPQEGNPSLQNVGTMNTDPSVGRKV